MALALGARLGPYEVVAPLGAGGMGEVWLARDARLDREVAIKILPSEFASDTRRQARFQREAKAIAHLNDPHICTLYDVGRDSGATYLVMELLEGETLTARIARGALPIDELTRTGIEIAEALANAHDAGIVHRDLKPSNVMITKSGVKLLDFGLAKILAAGGNEASEDPTAIRSTAGAVVGTTPYMSPEQALGGEVDHRSDIFSFGSLLYEMATGQMAFEGRTTTETLELILHSEPVPITQLNDKIPDTLDRVVRQCMQKDPSRRYQSAHEVVVDLQNLKNDRHTGKVLRAALPKRRLTVAMLAAVLLIAASVGLRPLLRGQQTGVSAATIDSIAVLPFTNNDPRNEYLSDGITENIIDNLSQLPGLKVMSRSSVFRFKESDLDPQKIGRQLKIRAIVSGRVLHVGDHLTVGVELVDVSDGRQLWGEQYSRTAADIFSLQGEISSAISEKLRIKLTSEQRQRLAKRYPNDPEAYALYLKGRYHSNKRTVAGLQRGIEFFQQAIAKDPAYALAYVGLADSYATYPDVAGTSAAEWHARAKAAVQKALQIDDSVAEAHATLGLIEQAAWNRDAAAREYRRAIELNSNYATAHHWYSLNLCTSRLPDEGLAEIKKAQQLDPLSPLINFTVGVEQYARGNDEAALREYKSTIDLDPEFGWGYIYLGLLYADGGQCEDGIVALRKGVDLTGRAPHAIGYLGYALARCGHPRPAQQLASELSERHASHVARALIASGLREKNEVFQQLDAAYRDRDPQLMHVSWQREYRDIRSDPRYFDLRKRVGIPP